MDKENLLLKYNKILDLFKIVDKYEFSEILENTITIITNNYNHYDKQHKIAGVYIIVNLYLKSKNFLKDKIQEILNDFYIFFDKEYDKYINSLLIADRFTADFNFYLKFLNKKISLK